MKEYLISLIILWSPLVFSESYSDPSELKGLSLGSGYARVKLVDMEKLELQCTEQSWYAFDATSESGKMMLSALLAARVSGATLSLQLHGCFDSGGRLYPKFNHVYLCEKPFCN